MTDPRPEDDDRFAPRQFGDRFSRFESEPDSRPVRQAEQHRSNDRSEILPATEAPAFEQREYRQTADSGPRWESPRGFWSALFSFEGRATRGHYWAVFVFGMALMLMPFAPLLISNPEGDVTAGISQPDEDLAQIESTVYLLWFPLTLVYAWLYCAVTIRRYHDRDKSGFWMMLLLVPVASIAVLLECGLLPGTRGPNQYGPDPRGL